MPKTASGTPYWVDGPTSPSHPHPSLVFLHGVLMDHRSWDRQIEGLADEFRIVRQDMLGHGACPDRPGPRRLEDFVEQVHELIQETCPGKAPVLIGFSMGALIAQAYAIRYPAELSGLVLMSAVYKRTDEELASVAARLENLEAAGIESVISAARERWFRTDEMEAQGERIEAILGWMREGDPTAKTKAYRVFTSEDHKTADKLGAVSCPALVMTGDGDKGSPPHMSRAMASDIPNARLLIIENQQHMMPVLAAEQVNAELREFLGGLSAQGDRQQ
jgi:(E)-2-((N-methylformamido)methylene)succinate hydrolase